MQTFLALVLALLAISGMVLLVLGPTKTFERTCVGRAHDAIVEGTPRAFVMVLGFLLRDDQRAETLARAMFKRLCDAPNPLGQSVYLILALGGHWSFVQGVEERLLDDGDAGGWTAATSAAFGIAVVTWVAACASDPGTVTRENVERYLDAYAYDGVMYGRKTCRTLGVDAPARSKWCVTTERRVARFDHFCVWINNSIGAWNLRYFLAFLAAQLGLVAYVAYACAYAVFHDLTRKDAWSLRFNQMTKTGERATLVTDKMLFYRFVSYHYPTAFALWAFCTLATILLAVFLVYNLRLAAKNVTTNETFKRDDLREAVKAMRAEPTKIDFEKVMKNAYDVGVLRNLLEVLFPPVQSEHPWRVPCSFPQKRKITKQKNA